MKVQRRGPRWRCGVVQQIAVLLLEGCGADALPPSSAAWLPFTALHDALELRVEFVDRQALLLDVAGQALRGLVLRPVGRRDRAGEDQPGVEFGGDMVARSSLSGGFFSSSVNEAEPRTTQST